MSLIACSVNKCINGLFDPLDIIENIADETLLLESADVIKQVGEKSMLLMDLAIKIEARSNFVLVTAINSEAHHLLSVLKKQFTVVENQSTDYSIAIKVSPLYNYHDILEKIKAPCALDIIRFILKTVNLLERDTHASFLAAGAFSYDFIDHFEKLPKSYKDPHALPNFIFYIPLSVITINHRKNLIDITCHSLDFVKNFKRAKKRSSERLQRVGKLVDKALHKKKPHTDSQVGQINTKKYSCDIEDEEFYSIIRKCKQHIKDGDVYQIVPSRTFIQPIKSSIKSYERLRAINKSPYMFFLKEKDYELFGASPETFIKVDKGGSRVHVRPIAGTRPRGFDEAGEINIELDARMHASLLLDEKELAEHMMLVDLARNDIASVCKPNTRAIKRLMGVDKFSHVMHLVSELTGQLKDEYDALHAYQSSMNMGTLMGAPKVKAAELLRGLEKTKRGFYGGAIGYIDKSGNLDTAIIIRSAFVKDNQAFVRAGCGVVFDSDEKLEANETRNKAQAVLRAIELADHS